jgi:aldose 1-epimerase
MPAEAASSSNSSVLTAPLQLQHGDLRLALRPDLGGCIAGLWLDGIPVMRSTAPDEALPSARLAASYPLLPYSNRLGFRRFRWRGAEYSTQPNFDNSPHSVHGLGWQRAWHTDVQREHEVVLSLKHPGDAHWPFAFEARQAFALGSDHLQCGLRITNTAAQPQPVGLGWHPYFPKRQRSRLHIELSQRWENDANELPTRAVEQAGIDGDVAYMSFDNCFAGWPGHARLRDEKLALRLSSNLPYLVVFTPPQRNYYCVEPVSHVSNAIHMADPAAHGLRTLAPGESFEAWMKLEVSRA